MLLPVIQTFFFSAEIFNLQKKNTAKIKCLLFNPKPQKFHTAEITGYMLSDFLTEFDCSQVRHRSLDFQGGWGGLRFVLGL
jgi:hypothetical protein